VLIIENLLIEKIFNVQCSIPNIKGLLTPEDSYATAFNLKIENSVLIIENLLIEKIFNVQYSIPNIKGLLTPEDSYATAFYLNIESSALIIDQLKQRLYYFR